MTHSQEQLLIERNAKLEKELASKNRELEIQISLEKIRETTMAMQRSEEIKEVSLVLLRQMQNLGIASAVCFVCVMNETDGSMELSPANDQTQNHATFKVGIDDHPVVRKMYDNWKAENKSLIIDLEGEALADYRRFLLQLGIQITPGIRAERRIYSMANFSKGLMGVVSDDFLPDESIHLLERLAIAFDGTYTRFLDLKKAEEQTREAQIEAALERVRSRSMAMHHSKELHEVADVLFQQMLKFGGNLLNAGVALCKQDADEDEFWVSSDSGIRPVISIPHTEDPVHKKLYEGWVNKLEFHSESRDGDELKAHYKYLASLPALKPFFDEEVASNRSYPEWQKWHAAYFSQGYLFMLTAEEYDEEKILVRFAKIFDQAYTRFLDLQKAETQARESQIQLALERVRARTMAMQKSDELSDAVYILFQQFKELGENPDQATIGVINEDENVIEYWVTMYGTQINKVFKFSMDEPNVTHKIYEAWKENKKTLMIDLRGDALIEFMTYRAGKGGAAINPDEKRRIINVAFFSKGLLNVQSNEERSEESIKLLERFSSVFEQTYTRFLDLQKAEAQSREAKIEAGLERVRYSAIAMQTSEDVGSATAVVFNEISSLGVEAMRCGITIIHPDMSADVWAATTTSEGKEMKGMGNIDFNDHPLWVGLFEGWKNKEENYSFALKGDDLRSYYKALASSSNYNSSYIKDQEFPEHFFYANFFEQGALFTFSLLPYDDNKRNILKRFTGVFSLTFRRFLDLQKAEAQARESQIQLALERVRARTMAMQKSEELREVIQVVYDQFVHLAIHVEHTGFIMDYKQRNDMHIWLADKHAVPFQVVIPYFDCAHWNSFIEAKEKGLDFFANTLNFEEKNKFYQDLFQHIGVPKEASDYYFSCLGLSISTVLLENVGLYIENFSGIPYSMEENKTLMRFGKVFQQTYTRFNDLKQAEAQALEAVKRASVDRIRAEIASMRTTDDLERITPLIWNELTTLGVPFIRCGVFIMDEAQQKVQTLLATPDGKAIATLHVPFEFNLPIIINGVEHWRNQQMYTEHWNAAAFSKSWAALSSLRDTSVELSQTEHPPENLYLHLLPFLQGMLYVGNETPLTEDELQLVQNLADAFSTAYARYEDFNKLESANTKIEKTLVDLKQTQAQLVQSEKMASLGELTAGIAHEIQNPLNFVNNFSEVNRELLAELNDEIEKENYEEVKMIAADITGNEEKIIHHGKRADSIVKGMLQHSRSSTGTKEPTDINALCDEYLRLAYHGLRAKDKTFNASMKTDYDETIVKLNIIPQDVGRVILNIITNAFYAVTEKKKNQSDGYEPLVSLHTKKRSDGVEIAIADNGNGIPQKIIDKIFQPFFTTKPTGQGTGLGLSLAYDILKAHGGNIKVETKENKGLPGEASVETATEFIIYLPD